MTEYKIGFDNYEIISYSNLEKYKTSNEKYMYIYDNIYTGVKWECVEFVRRWLIINYKITFEEVESAYNIFMHPYLCFKHLTYGNRVPYEKHHNGSIGNTFPYIGSIIIWDKNKKQPYGHCAIVSNYDNNYIYVSEQNWDNKKWEQNYSRKIKYKFGINNSIILVDNNRYKINILGWLILKNL